MANKCYNILKGASLSVGVYAVAEHLTKLPSDLSPEPIFKQMRRLEEVKQNTQKELDAFAQSERTLEIPASLANYQSYLAGLKQIHLIDTDNRETQTKIIQRLIHKIEVFPESTRLHYYASERLFPAMMKEPGESSDIFLNRGSKTVDRSGPTMNRTWN